VLVCLKIDKPSIPEGISECRATNGFFVSVWAFALALTASQQHGLCCGMGQVWTREHCSGSPFSSRTLAGVSSYGRLCTQPFTCKSRKALDGPEKVRLLRCCGGARLLRRTYTSCRLAELLRLFCLARISQGKKCACSDKKNCHTCDWTERGSICTRCKNKHYLKDGECVRDCPTALTNVPVKK